MHPHVYTNNIIIHTASLIPYMDVEPRVIAPSWIISSPGFQLRKHMNNLLIVGNYKGIPYKKWRVWMNQFKHGEVPFTAFCMVNQGDDDFLVETGAAVFAHECGDKSPYNGIISSMETAIYEVHSKAMDDIEPEILAAVEYKWEKYIADNPESAGN